MAISYSHDFGGVVLIKVTGDRHTDKDGFHTRKIILIDDEGNELDITIYGYKAERVGFTLED
jgi:hypothetical protein